MIRGVLLDLDGTVYRGNHAVPGAARFIELLRRRRVPYLYVTNRASRTLERIRGQLAGYGLPCETSEILTAAEATADWLDGGSVYMIGEEGLEQALTSRGFMLTNEHPEDEGSPDYNAFPDYVVVGLDEHLTYAKLARATRHILAGARFVGTNPDTALNTDDGVAPGAGATLAALAAATGARPTVIGKPETIMIQIALQRLGLPKDEVVMVGDNLETDIRGAAAAGLPTALLLTGISTERDLRESDVEPTWVARDYEELTELLFGADL
ncbi:MAG: HAD-IIA family hydrolase [bacterium]|nr:HAD-IIA family hydrolase [bacterium]